jgi:hypothetical protein
MQVILGVFMHDELDGMNGPSSSSQAAGGQGKMCWSSCTTLPMVHGALTRFAMGVRGFFRACLAPYLAVALTVA